MTISTYQELKDSIGNWSARADLATGGANVARADEIIDNAEAYINRELRAREMETTNATFSITGEFVALPTDFAEVKSLWLNTSPRKFLTHEPDESQLRLYTTSGEPRFYNIVGTNFHFAPVPATTQSSTLIYYLKVPALTGSATTNWLLTAHPDVYMAACQAWTALFLKDMESFSAWTQVANVLLDSLKKSTARSRAASGMQVRLA